MYILDGFSCVRVLTFTKSVNKFLFFHKRWIPKMIKGCWNCNVWSVWGEEAEQVA